MSDKNDSVGMDFLDSLSRRWVTTYIPIGMFLLVAVSVLLDGDHCLQAQQGAAVARRQSVLGHEADPGALQEIVVRHRLSGVAVQHDAGGLHFHLPVAGGSGVRRLRDRAAALQGRAPGRPGDLHGLPDSTFHPVHSVGGGAAELRAVQYPLGAGVHLPDVPDPVLACC